MKKNRVLFWLFLGSVAALYFSCMGRPVKISSPASVSQTKSQPISAEKNVIKETGNVVIDDFETGGNRNNLGGERGSWNLTPDDPDTNISMELVKVGDSQNQSQVLKMAYDFGGPQPTKVGYWTKLQDFNAVAYDHLVFDVKGDSGEGFTSLFLVEIKKFKDAQKIDEIKGTHLVQEIDQNWKTVSIPLNMFTGLFDQTNQNIWRNPSLAKKGLVELVINFESRRVNQKKGVLYFDNLRFAKLGNPGLTIMDQPPRKGIKTEKRLEGVEFANFLAKRLQGFPKEVLPNKTFPEDDKEFLKLIARDTWRFFDEVIDRQHQLPLDTIQLGKKEPMSSETSIGDYTNVTNIGVYLMCVVSAYDLGFITREDAVRRVKATLDTVEKLEHHSSGFLYNYYDTTTLERTSYFVSLVDSGWLDAGLYVVKNAFAEELKEQCERMLTKHNFSFFYNDVNQQMSHGYFAHLNVRSDYDYGSFYTETRAISFIAIGRGDVPEEHWFRMTRTYPESYGWQTSVPEDRTLRTTLGHTYYGGYYEWKGLQFVPSWGGSMFEALMPTIILDEIKDAPQGLGLNDLRHAEGQIKYASEVMKYPAWGMSPSSVPEGGYSEYGAAPLGSKGYKPGALTPHATFLALEFVPKEAIQNARELIKRFPVYGEYGFYDAVNPQTGAVAMKYLSLDQAMILIPINNYLNDGAIRKRFKNDSIYEKAKSLLSEEQFFSVSPPTTTPKK